MKTVKKYISLSDFMQEATTEILQKHGAFFAFGQSQFDTQKKEGVQYVSDGYGLYIPKNNFQQFNVDFEKMQEEKTKEHLAEFGLDRIMKYNLSNYECFYTGDVYDAVSAMSSYGIDKNELNKKAWEIFDKFKNEF